MKAIVCEMCGSQDLIKQDGMYVCQNCGTKYAPEEAKKLLVEISGSIKVDNTDKLENYFQLARRAAKDGNSVDAAKYYDLIRQENPENWEAQFYAVYYNLMQAKVGDIQQASSLLINTVSSVFSLIANTVNDENSKLEAAAAVKDVANDSLNLYRMFAAADKSHFEQFNDDAEKLVSYMYNHVKGFYLNLISLASKVLEMSIYDVDSLIPLSINIRKEANEILADGWNLYSHHIGVWKNVKTTNDERETFFKMLKAQTELIQKYDDSYNPPTLNERSSSCYVATAVYGSYDCPQVWTLRRYRDYTLAETWYGRAFIRTYYAISPTLVSWFGETAWFKNMWKPILDRMVKELNEKGVANTPYNDREW